MFEVRDYLLVLALQMNKVKIRRDLGADIAYDLTDGVLNYYVLLEGCNRKLVDDNARVV